MSETVDIPLIFSIFAIIISILHFLLNYISKKRTQIPTINISLNELPPYKDRNTKTLISIQNTGSSIAYKPKLYITYSYAEGVVHIPIDDAVINPNEIIERREKLVEPPSGTHEIKFIVGVGKRRFLGGEFEFTKTVEIAVK
ncbi:MAG: hypothetical protein CEE43_02275 [Promethearchaeota archaeon Loki_b32]|nr:MAG: hypothetical protein CEE43_02275 [Candidatus Lokiarchaeota archaeon Loki_b32]